MCNEQSNVELHSLKVELQETTPDVISASLKSPTASLQSSEIVPLEVSASLLASETAVLPSQSNSFPTITDKPQVQCAINQAAHEHESMIWRTSTIQSSAMLQNTKLQGTNMSNAAMPGSMVSSTPRVQVRSGFLSNASVLKNGVNHDLYPSSLYKYSGNPPRQLREPIKQRQMTRAVATDKQNSLSKPASSSLNTADALEETSTQKSSTMSGDFEQAVQKNVADPISCAEPPSKKQKLNSLEESMDQMNDIVHISGVDVGEEKKMMMPVLMAKRRSSGQEKGDSLFLEKKPLHDKVVNLANNWGVSFVNEDVELCLSLAVEEWFRSILTRLIRFSDQRRDAAKHNQQVLVTSDVGGQVRILRQKAREALEAKDRAEQKEAGNQNKKVTEAQEKPNLKSQKDCKDNKKTKEIATKVTVPRPGSTEEMLLKWEIMAEQARLKRESEAGVKGQENRDTSLLSIQKKTNLGTTNPLAADSGRPPGSNPQLLTAQPQKRITVNDLISVLEMDSITAKSTILYRLYEKSQLK